MSNQRPASGVRLVACLAALFCIGFTARPGFAAGCSAFAAPLPTLVASLRFSNLAVTSPGVPAMVVGTLLKLSGPVKIESAERELQSAAFLLTQGSVGPYIFAITLKDGTTKTETVLPASSPATPTMHVTSLANVAFIELSSDNHEGEILQVCTL